MKTKVGDFVKICHVWTKPDGTRRAGLCWSTNQVESIWRGMVGIREFQFMRKRNYYRSWVRVNSA